MTETPNDRHRDTPALHPHMLHPHPPRTLPHLLPRLALPTRTETAPADTEENQGQHVTDTICEQEPK